MLLPPFDSWEQCCCEHGCSNWNSLSTKKMKQKQWVIHSRIWLPRLTSFPLLSLLFLPVEANCPVTSCPLRGPWDVELSEGPDQRPARSRGLPAATWVRLEVDPSLGKSQQPIVASQLLSHKRPRARAKPLVILTHRNCDTTKVCFVKPLRFGVIFCAALDN